MSDGLEGRFDSDYATFMHMRTPAFHVEPQVRPTRDRDDAQRRTTMLWTERLWENAPLWFLVHLWEGGRVEHGYAMDPDTGGPGPMFLSSQDGSWCELSTVSEDGTREVWEGGPRRLWANIEAVMRFWRHLGEPGWSRFGITVWFDDKQMVWLDQPTSENCWSLPLPG